MHTPRLPHGVDEATLLSGHINTEHSAALPGYAVGKVIGEGGFCQVRRDAYTYTVHPAGHATQQHYEQILGL